MMFLYTNVRFLARSKSWDGLEGATRDMGGLEGVRQHP